MQELEYRIRLEVMVSHTVNLVKKKRERGYLSDKEISVLTKLNIRRVLYICVQCYDSLSVCLCVPLAIYLSTVFY